MKFLYLFFRKLRSTLAYISGRMNTASLHFRTFGNQAISIASGCSFGQDVLLRATDGGSISLGRRVNLAAGVQIITQGGRVEVADDVFIGVGSIIISREFILIGRDALIAEYVVIRDQDHLIDSRPIRSAGFKTTPVHIGSDVWIGCKATVLRGAYVGDRCVIGAHALVKSRIPDDMLAVGVPARVIKQRASDK